MILIDTGQMNIIWQYNLDSCAVKSRHFPSFISELFDNYMQQDAHEFLNYLLNTVADLLQGKENRKFYTHL